ncbi:MAG: TRAP transporter small permease [Deferrisomatales bacterium]|nr:TRAP transporter small permease [Deferrisomatales bacterium]
MKTLDALLERVERWVIFVCFATSLVALTYGVLTRYAVRRPFAWPDELSLYLFLLMTFVGAAASVRSGTELRVDALYERFPGARFGLDLWMHAVRLLAGVLIAVYGWKFVAVERMFMNYTPILGIPVPWIAAMLPLFGGLLIVRTVLKLAELFGER